MTIPVTELANLIKAWESSQQKTETPLQTRARTGEVSPSLDSPEFWRYFGSQVEMVLRLEAALDERERRGEPVDAYRAKMPRIWRAIVAPTVSWSTRPQGSNSDTYPPGELATLQIMSEALNGTAAAQTLTLEARLGVVRSRLAEALTAVDDLSIEDHPVERRLRFLIEQAARFADDVERFGIATVDAVVADVIGDLQELADDDDVDIEPTKREHLRFVATQLSLSVAGSALFTSSLAAGQALLQLMP